MNVKEIIVKHLQEIGADGLCNCDIECGCAIKDDFPCGDSFSECVPAKRTICQDKESEFFGGDFYIPYNQPESEQEPE